MLFKNLTAYALTEGNWLRLTNKFRSDLAKFQYVQLGAHDLSTMGWVAPCLHEPDFLTHHVERFVLLKLAIEKRTIPSSVLKKEIEKEAKKVEKDQGFYPGRKAMKEIKERVIDLLTPRAFPITKYVSVIIDLDRDYLMIDTASSKVADEVIKALFKADDRFPVQLFKYQQSVTEQMANWIVDGAPWKFTFDDQVTLQADSAGKKVIYVNMQTAEETLSDHLENGMIVSAMSMTFDDKLSFVLDEGVVISKIKAHEKLVREFSEDENEFDANLLLAGSELSDLLYSINDQLSVMRDVSGDLV